MRRTAAALAALFFFLYIASAPAAERGEVHVTLKEWKVRVSRASIPAGTPVEFEIRNTGTVVHELVLEKLGDVDNPLTYPLPNGGTGEMEVEKIMPGQVRRVVWTISRPGDYQLACHMPTHYMNGMVAKLTVVAR